MVATTTYGLEKPTVGASTSTWGGILNSDLDLLDDLLDGTVAIAPNLSTLKIGGVAVSSTAAELNLLDGLLATTVELNYVGGVTSSIQTQIDDILTAPTLGSVITITGGTQSWTVTAGAENLTFAYNGVNVMRVDGSGNLVVTGNIETAGTIS
tara:strand:+ start:667 stop:1125 length:459 start_codon:yes stop_codon:yes gene_type:complete